MASGVKTFADIFGNCDNNGDPGDDRPIACDCQDQAASPGNRIFSFKSDEYDYGFSNRGFVADDEAAASRFPATGSASSRTKPPASYPDASQTRYDPYDHINTKHPTSFCGTIFHLIFLSAGSPVLLLPNNFVGTGFVLGAGTMLLIFAFYAYSMRLILSSAYETCKLNRVPSISYLALVHDAFATGPAFVRPLATAARLLLSCVFILEWYIGCILIYVLMATDLPPVCSRWLPAAASAVLSAPNIAWLLLVAILPVCLIRRLKFLEPCSTLGFLFNFVAILLVLYYAATDSVPWKGSFGSWSAAKIPLLMGTVFININVTGLILSLKNELKCPQQFERPCGVMNVAYTTILATYLIFCTFLELKYGGTVPENAIDIIPSHMVLSLVTTICYVLGLYLLLPLLLYVPLNVLWNDLLKDQRMLAPRKLLWEYVTRVVLVALAAFLAYLNPNISFLVSLVGTVGSSIDSIIFPAIVHSLVEWKIGGRDRRMAMLLAKNSILFLLGLGLMTAGLIDCVSELKT